MFARRAEPRNRALELASQVKSIARALNFKVAPSMQMRAKLVEQIGAVIGQCAECAIYIGRIEQIDAVIGRTRRVRNARLECTDRALNLKAVSDAKCTPDRPKF